MLKVTHKMPLLDEVLQKLRAELPATCRYHSVSHTQDEVLPAAEQLADTSGLHDDQKQLLLAAAAFHDTGYTNGSSEGHEERSIEIAQETLASHGYTGEQIHAVADIIRSTKMPQNPGSLVEAIMCDADLALLGQPWEKYFARVEDLRTEWEATGGEPIPEEEWYEQRIRFLSSHTYWTEAAHTLFDTQKARNIARLRELLEEYRAGESTPR